MRLSILLYACPASVFWKRVTLCSSFTAFKQLQRAVRARGGGAKRRLETLDPESCIRGGPRGGAGRRREPYLRSLSSLGLWAKIIASVSVRASWGLHHEADPGMFLLKSKRCSDAKLPAPGKG